MPYETSESSVLLYTFTIIIDKKIVDITIAYSTLTLSQIKVQFFFLSSRININHHVPSNSIAITFLIDV